MSSTQFHHSFEAIGTAWVLDIYEEVATQTSQQLIESIYQRIEEFDKTYSRFRDDSLVTQVAQTSGSFKFPDDAEELFKIYADLYNITEGAFTPLIGNVLEDAGYDRHYSLESNAIRPTRSWEETFSYSNKNLMMKKPATLDFGAAGKGYLVDIVSKLIQESGFRSFCVDAGGDMYYSNTDTESLRVGLEHPEHTDQVIGVATIHNESICGSSGNRRKWKEYHHIINPFTLSSPMDKLAVWVIAPKAIIADALTTCLFFVQPEVLLPHYTFEYAIVNSDYSLQKSASFAAEFFKV